MEGGWCLKPHGLPSSVGPDSRGAKTLGWLHADVQEGGFEDGSLVLYLHRGEGLGGDPVTAAHDVVVVVRALPEQPGRMSQ